MKSFRKGTYRVLILLVYLFTLQASTGSALLSIYASVADGVVYIKEQKPKPSPKPQVILRKHISTVSNEKTQSSGAFIVAPFSLPKIKDFSSVILSNHLTSLDFTEYGKLKNRAPPKFC